MAEGVFDCFKARTAVGSRSSSPSGSKVPRVSPGHGQYETPIEVDYCREQSWLDVTPGSDGSRFLLLQEQARFQVRRGPAAGAGP